MEKDQIKSMVHSRGGPDTVAPKRRPIRVATKIGRNQLCPCGSGLKYKKCCIDKEGQIWQR